MDTLAISAQVTGFVVWPLMSGDVQLWLIPVAVILISARWWENYASEQSFFGSYEYADVVGTLSVCLSDRWAGRSVGWLGYYPLFSCIPSSQSTAIVVINLLFVSASLFLHCLKTVNFTRRIFLQFLCGGWFS